MIIEPHATSRFTFLAWCSATSLFLFFFSVSIAMYETPLGFLQFVTFVIVLYGAGVSYQYASEIFRCHQDENNYVDWTNLLWHLGKVHVGYAIAGVSVGLAKWLQGETGWLLAFFGLLFGYFWAMHYLLSSRKLVKKLLGSAQPT
jgi:hypothetical protein